MIDSKAKQLLDKLHIEEIEHALSRNGRLINLWQNVEGGITIESWVQVEYSAYIPRTDLEAYLEDRKAAAEREAEIERRIGGVVKEALEVADFEAYESEGVEIVHLYPNGFVRKWGDATSIPVPTSRIRAALDAQRNADAIVKDMMEGPAHGDHLRDATKKVEPVHPTRTDEVGEGPWRVDYAGAFSWVVTDGGKRYSKYECPDPMTPDQTKWASESERDRLNAKWRAEEERKARDAAHERLIEERVDAFLERFRGGVSWLWGKHIELFIGNNGMIFSPKSAQHETVRFAYPDLLAHLAARGIHAPEPKPEISAELRRRLVERVKYCLSSSTRFWPENWEYAHFDERGINMAGKTTSNCTAAQAEAFLAEVAKMGEGT